LKKKSQTFEIFFRNFSREPDVLKKILYQKISRITTHRRSPFIQNSHSKNPVRFFSSFTLSGFTIPKQAFLSFQHAKLCWKKGDPYSPAIFAGQILIKTP
jgi:hypothetical protein